MHSCSKRQDDDALYVACMYAHVCMYVCGMSSRPCHTNTVCSSRATSITASPRYTCMYACMYVCMCACSVILITASPRYVCMHVCACVCVCVHVRGVVQS
jgi:hypothetical protein